MVATLTKEWTAWLQGSYARQLPTANYSTLGINSVATGLSCVTSPAPPSPYTAWLQADTSQAHNGTLNRADFSIGSPTGTQRVGFNIQAHIRRDGGTLSTACYVMRQSVVNSTVLAWKWNTSGNLEIYACDILLVTVSVSTSTTTHLNMYMANTVAVGGVATQGTGDWQIIVYQDGSQICNRVVSSTTTGLDPTAFVNIGENAAAGSNTVKWYLQPVWGSYTDFNDPLPKMTIKERGYTLAGTPLYNTFTKSTGTDAAALIDERPLTGTGTTDTDYIDGAAGQVQTNTPATSLLGAGDILYAVAGHIWARQTLASKNVTANLIHVENSTASQAKCNGASGTGTTIAYNTGGARRPLTTAYGSVYINCENEWMQVSADDNPGGASGNLTVVRGVLGSTNASHASGTVLQWVIVGQQATISGASSYAEQLLASSRTATYELAPDGTAWSGKANSYIDTIEFGNSINANAGTETYREDGLLIEAAIAVSGDSPPTLPTAPVNPCLLAKRKRVLTQTMEMPQRRQNYMGIFTVTPPPASSSRRRQSAFI